MSTLTISGLAAERQRCNWYAVFEPSESHHETIVARIPLDRQAILSRCLGRVRRWRIPPNWSRAEWMEEARAQAQVELVIAETDKAGAGAPAQLFSRVLNGLLKRYRQEWSFASRARYGSRCQPPAEGGPDMDVEAAQDTLAMAIARLPVEERALIHSLYWQEQTERELAMALGVSQQAISKRKKKILRLLAALLQR